MRSASKAIPAACTVALATLVAGGCGQTRIDVHKAATFIEEAVQTKVGARVRSVVCPKEVAVKARATFSCVVTGRDGSTGRAQVTQRDDKGNMTVRTPFLQPRRAEHAITSELSKATPGTTIECQEIIVVGKGRRFSCRATAAGATRKIAATQTNANGKFTYDVN